MSTSELILRPDKLQWRSFLDVHPQATIFHTPEMFEVFSKSKGHQPLVCASTDSSGQISALFLPVIVTLQEGLLSRFSSRAITFGGFLQSEDSDKLADMVRYWDRDIRKKVVFSEIRHLSDMSRTHQFLEKAGYHFQEYLNFLLDLTKPVETLLGQIHKDARANIRRSEKRGLIVEPLVSDSELPIFIDLLQQTFARLRAPLADRSLFENIYRILYPKGMAQILLAKVEGKVIAGYLTLLYRGMMYGWYCGDDIEYRKYCPNDTIMWNIIRWGHEHGYKTLDFGWAGRADESSTVRNFKAKYGGELVRYGRHLKVYSPLLLKTIKTLNPIRKKIFRRK